MENRGYHIHLLSRCEVLQGSVQTSKAAKYTHRHRSTDNLLGLALTRRIGLNAYSYRCCEEREAGAKQVKRKATEKDTWRKTSGKRWSSRSSPRAESTGSSLPTWPFPGDILLLPPGPLSSSFSSSFSSLSPPRFLCRLGRSSCTRPSMSRWCSAALATRMRLEVVSVERTLSTFR